MTSQSLERRTTANNSGRSADADTGWRVRSSEQTAWGGAQRTTLRRHGSTARGGVGGAGRWLTAALQPVLAASSARPIRTLLMRENGSAYVCPGQAPAVLTLSALCHAAVLIGMTVRRKISPHVGNSSLPPLRVHHGRSAHCGQDPGTEQTQLSARTHTVHRAQTEHRGSTVGPSASRIRIHAL